MSDEEQGYSLVSLDDDIKVEPAVPVEEIESCNYTELFCNIFKVFWLAVCLAVLCLAIFLLLEPSHLE